MNQKLYLARTIREILLYEFSHVNLFVQFQKIVVCCFKKLLLKNMKTFLKLNLV